jgi:hypothetical protein
VFDAAPIGNTPSVSGSASLRPASREVSGRARSGNADPCRRPERANPQQLPTLEWTSRPKPSSRHHLLFTIFAEQAALHRSDANLFFFKGYVSAHSTPK